MSTTYTPLPPLAQQHLITIIRTTTRVYYFAGLVEGTWKGNKPIYDNIRAFDPIRTFESTRLTKSALLASKSSTQPGAAGLGAGTSDSPSSCFDDQVRDFIGDHTKEVIVLGNLPCCRSEGFKSGNQDAGNNEGCENSQDQDVTFRRENNIAFEIFLTWTYTKSIHKSMSIPNSLRNTPQDQLIAHATWRLLTQCFFLAQFLQEPEFQNATIDALIGLNRAQHKTFGSILGTNAAYCKLVWANTPAGSPLRAMILDHLLVDVLLIDSKMKMFPLELLAELSFLAVRNSRKVIHFGRYDGPWEKDLCVYHTHPGSEAGYSCTKESGWGAWFTRLALAMEPDE